MKVCYINLEAEEVAEPFSFRVQAEETVGQLKVRLSKFMNMDCSVMKVGQIICTRLGSFGIKKMSIRAEVQYSFDNSVFFSHRLFRSIEETFFVLVGSTTSTRLLQQRTALPRHRRQPGGL